MRSPASSQWAIILPCRSRRRASSPFGERHQVGHADHRDLVDRRQPADALALGDVALEVARRRVAGRDGGGRRERVGADAAAWSGSAAPVSSSLTSCEAALTFVSDVGAALLEASGRRAPRARPGGRRRACRSRPRRRRLAVASPRPRLLGARSRPRCRRRRRRSATARNASTPLSAAAGSAAWAGGRRRVGADAHDPAEPAAVLEVAVDGVREVGAVHEGAVLGLTGSP